MADDFMGQFVDPQMLTPNFGHVTPAPEVGPQTPVTELSQVDPLAGFQPFPGGAEMPFQNIEGDLMRLRAEIPFVPIMKWPVMVRSVFLVSKVAQSINIPRGVVLAMFRGSADFWVSRAGQALDPTLATNFQNAAGGQVDDNFAAIFKPDFAWFYVGGMSEVSVISATAGCVVQLIGMAPNTFGNR